MPESPIWRSNPPVAPLPFLIDDSNAPSDEMVEMAIACSTFETDVTVSVLALPEPEITISHGGSPASLIGGGGCHDGVGGLQIIVFAVMLAK